MLDPRSKEILNEFYHSDIKVQIPLRLVECVSPRVYLLALPLAIEV
jgi:hypothetical protein